MAESLQEQLGELGLSANEAKTYLALLKLGGASASEAAARAGIDRTVEYAVLNRLIAKGLVSYLFKEGKKIFSATRPERLVELMAEKKELAEDLVPSLEKISPKKEEEERVEVVRGGEGIKRIYNDVLRDKKDLYVTGHVGMGRRVVPQAFKIFERHRVKAGLKRVQLVRESLRKQVRETAFESTETRFLPDEFFAAEAATVFYGRKTVIVLPFKHESVLIFIDSPGIADMYRKYFNLLWKIAKK